MADDFAAAAERLRSAQRRLLPEVGAGLEVVARELVSDAELSARMTLPRRGGYGQQVADETEFKVALQRSGRGWKLTITAVGPDYRLDRDGRIRHPVYAKGPREEWNWSKQPQRVRTGWFSRPMRAGRPRARGELIAAVSRTTRGGRR